jgi:hypothetical protein
MKVVPREKNNQEMCEKIKFTGIVTAVEVRWSKIMKTRIVKILHKCK